MACPTGNKMTTFWAMHCIAPKYERALTAPAAIVHARMNHISDAELSRDGLAKDQRGQLFRYYSLSEVDELRLVLFDIDVTRAPYSISCTWVRLLGEWRALHFLPPSGTSTSVTIANALTWKTF